MLLFLSALLITLGGWGDNMEDARSLAVGTTRPSLPSNLAYSGVLAATCLLTYLSATSLLNASGRFARGNVLLGGMWATIAAIFVLRVDARQSREAIASRSTATLASALLCLLYFLAFPPSAGGLAIVAGIGALLLSLIGRQLQVVTCAITTAVIFVAATIDGGAAWPQPLFRTVDTAIGVFIGFLASCLLGFMDRLGRRT